jgi:arsenate reductase (thioredoxin)
VVTWSFQHRALGAVAAAGAVVEELMQDRIYNVLFIGTGNTARSIMAEGLLNHFGRGRFRAYSGGSFPEGVVHPLALAELAALQLPVADYRSKSWDEFALPGAPQMDFVFTACDDAAGEVCPVWPGQPVSAHWGVEDPEAVEGPDEQKVQAFRRAAVLLKRRIELFLALPMQRLDAIALHRELRDIGRTGSGLSA